MSTDTELTIASLWLLYLIRSVAAYLVLGVVCRIVHNSHLRFRLYGMLLGAMVVAWVAFWWTSLSVAPTSHSISASPFQANWLWLLSPTLVGLLSVLSPYVIWGYVTVVGLLLLQFGTRFWQLSAFLRTSEPAAEGLSFLLELVRTDSGRPLCDVRVVPGLRSPATTGWWHPKVLLPKELLPLLDSKQLLYVLRHELIHIRRRDFLWDRLATLGCYFIFFNPLAWLARRQLRWERELRCDEDVVEHSHEARVEYAGCLTTLASQWFLKHELAGPVDFLSSPRSLLAARVRALLKRQAVSYSPYKRAIIGFIVTISLGLAVWLMPEIEIRLPEVAPHLVVKTPMVVYRVKMVSVDSRTRIISKPPKPAALGSPAIILRSGPVPPNLEVPTNIPIFSGAAQPQSYPFTESDDASLSEPTAGEEAEQNRRTIASIWDASRPVATPGKAAKLGRVAERAARLGIAVVGSQLGDHDRDKLIQ